MSGPFFEQLEVGTTFDSARMTLTEGHAAWFLALTGDRAAVHLDASIARRAGYDAAPLSTSLVAHVGIGHSTVATREVVANLFYSSVAFVKPVFAGATLRTSTSVLARAEATDRADRPPRGKVLLGMTTVDDDGELVMQMTRCALVRKRYRIDTGADDRVDLPGTLDLTAVRGGWARFGAALDPPPDAWVRGALGGDDQREPVTGALELVRATGNLAKAHRDAAFGQHGRRLVYGGHTLALAQAALSRQLAVDHAVVGWRSASHPAPVFEEDLLATSVIDPVELGVGDGLRLTEFGAETSVVAAASSGAGGAGVPVPRLVQRWQPIVLTRSQAGLRSDSKLH